MKKNLLWVIILIALILSFMVGKYTSRNVIIPDVPTDSSVFLNAQREIDSLKIVSDTFLVRYYRAKNKERVAWERLREKQNEIKKFTDTNFVDFWKNKGFIVASEIRDNIPAWRCEKDFMEYVSFNEIKLETYEEEILPAKDSMIILLLDKNITDSLIISNKNIQIDNLKTINKSLQNSLNESTEATMLCLNSNKKIKKQRNFFIWGFGILVTINGINLILK